MTYRIPPITIDDLRAIHARSEAWGPWRHTRPKESLARCRLYGLVSKVSMRPTHVGCVYSELVLTRSLPTMPLHVARWIVESADNPDATQVEIAERLGITPQAAYKAKIRAGDWLTFFGAGPSIARHIIAAVDSAERAKTENP